MALLDTAAILTWSLLLLKFCWTKEINLLLHPDYVWLAYVAGFFLMGLGLYKIVKLVGRSLNRSSRRLARARAQAAEAMPHFSLFPFGSGLLLGVALFGLNFTPQPFASQTALDRGVTDTLTLTRSQPQSFRSKSRPEERTLTEWVRTLNVYPEPDAYKDQKAKIEGFVIHVKDQPDDVLTLSRFVITCCAADAYPIGIPVKLKGSRSTYAPDQWLRVEGKMATQTLSGKRQLVVMATALTKIPKPDAPYEY
ncbi:MAG: TIGR03943 family protein [Timaviella obliquedivisa GSE-PSE-MK23-08B]|jgi:uncharacterized repeat protein (TIGR03943 family)|nr:TIGR03943 family protein [Timaviella obliquedivisa GSE-PSE-MK23-08B]